MQTNIDELDSVEINKGISNDFNKGQKMEILENDQQLLFSNTDFPQFYYEEKKHKMSQYGLVMESDEIQVKDDFTQTVINKLNLDSVKPYDNTDSIFKNYSFFNLSRDPAAQQFKLKNIIQPKQFVKFSQLSGITDEKSQIRCIYAINPKNIFIINGSQEVNKKFLVNFSETYLFIYYAEQHEVQRDTTR